MPKRLFRASGGAGVRWTPLAKQEAPTEPTGETGEERKQKLTSAGYDYDMVQKKVNELLNDK